MANPSKQKGTAWETAVLRWLHEVGFSDAYRTGSADFGHGDVVIPSLRVSIECKSVAKVTLSEYQSQARAIRERNPHLVAVVVCVKKKGSTSPADAYWVVDGPNLLVLLGSGLASLTRETVTPA